MCKYTFHQSSTCYEHQDPKDHSHPRSHHHSHHRSQPSSPKSKDKKIPRQPCQWIQIAQPCNWGMGLLTCPIFASSALRIEGPMIIRVVKYMCPRHDFRGVYDRNLVKMVEERKTGGSWFGPPDMTPEPRKREVEKKKVQRKDDIKLCVAM